MSHPMLGEFCEACLFDEIDVSPSQVEILATEDHEASTPRMTRPEEEVEEPPVVISSKYLPR